jgi:predicted nucleic acid-binding protein
LACALEKKADYIVSRDPHLRNIKHYHGIQIVDATTFIEKVKVCVGSGHGERLVIKDKCQK